MKQTNPMKLKLKTEELLKRYQKLLEQLKEIQVETRKIKHETEEITKENPIFGVFAFLVVSLNTDYLESLNNLDLSNRKEHVARALELLSKNQKERR